MIAVTTNNVITMTKFMIVTIMTSTSTVTITVVMYNVDKGKSNWVYNDSSNDDAQ